MATERSILLDEDWAGVSFLAPKESLSDLADNKRRYFTSASRKFINSSMGGHWVVNPIPQFTANCDLPHASIFSGSMDDPGRWWSEVLDDNAQVIHFRPGVPKFNSLTTFFTNFYNVESGLLARTGRTPGVFFTLGRVAGGIASLPLQPFILGSAILNFFLSTPKSKYYYLQPTTFPYRQAVQTILHFLMSNMGLLVGRTMDDEKYFENSTDILPGEMDHASMAQYYGPLLDNGFFTHRGAIDIFALSTNARRLANDFRKNVERVIETAAGDVDNAIMAPGFEGAKKRSAILDKIYTDAVEGSLQNLQSNPITLDKFVETFKDNETWSVDGDGAIDWMNTSLTVPVVNEDMDPNADPGMIEKAKNYLTKTWEQMKLEKDWGADFVSFRVNWTGTQSEDFSNQTGESSLASKINEISGRARELRFNTMEGNIVGGVVGDMLNKAKTAVTDFMQGALAQVQLSGAIALAGNAFADIQKMYQASSASLNRTSFDIHLRSWSSDPFVRLQTLYYPLAHIMALALPRATGPASYDGPFLVEVYNQGRSIIREGMIESLSITRGVGNVGFDKDNNVMGIDISVTVVDMSSIISVPIAPSVSPFLTTASGLTGTALSKTANLMGAEFDGVDFTDKAAMAVNKRTYSDDSKFTDYMNTLAALPLEHLIDPRRKWKLRMSRLKAEMESQRTSAHMGSAIFDTVGGEWAKVLFWFQRKTLMLQQGTFFTGVPCFYAA